MWLNNIKIGSRIAAVVVALVLVSITFVLVLTSKMRQVDSTYSYLLDNSAQGSVWLARANNRIAILGYAGFKTATYDQGSKQAQEAAKEHESALDAVRTNLGNAEKLLPARAPQIESIKTQFSEIERLTKAGIAASLKGEKAKGIELLEQADPLLTHMNDEVARAISDISADLKKTSTSVSTDIDYQSYLFLGIATAVGAAALLLSLLLSSKTITGPLQRLQTRMVDLAGGDLSVEVEGQTRGDEVGRMAQAVQVFKTNAITAREVEAQAAAARQATEEERARTEAQKASAAREQQVVVEMLADGLTKLSDGDLTVRLTGFPGEYGKLESDFNAALGKLEEAMTVIARGGNAIQSGSGEISQASEDLSKRTEQQAANLEETAAALEEITSTVKQTAEGAKHAQDVVLSAKADAETSGRVVEDAVAAMNEIEKSSQEITKIISVIDEIAFQTNLLALNAGVEAARAGDAGRGFAVVASEVRALAQRSAEAAKQIKELISSSTTQVASGVDLVGETGKALSRIVRQVSDITGIVGEIAASAQEQATGLTQVNTAVAQMDQITQQNAAMVEQSTAASRSLNDEAEQLNALLRRFRIGQRHGSVVSLDSTRQASPAKKIKPVAAPSRVVAAGHGRTATATARKPVIEPDSWEDF